MKQLLFRIVVLAIAILSTMTASARLREPKPLKQLISTQITAGDMKALEQTDVNFLLSLDNDRLLYYFRQQAGLDALSGVSPYGGWESSDLKGHSLGHYLTAMSILYAQSKSETVLNKINHVVAVLRQAQQNQGTSYIGAFGDGALTTCENDGSGWAPYYTMHKILQGLIDAYVYAGNETALEAASDMGNYFYNRTLRLTDQENWNKVLDIMEIGGFPEAMLNLYAITRNENHLKGGQFFHQMSKLSPSANGQDILSDSRTANFHHANATIPQFIAAERDYELTGDKTMLAAATNFWENVTGHRMYCNGSTAYHEHWNLLPDRLSQEINGLAGETCCTNNMIKLSNDLFRFSRNPKYVEYVERATLNHIMGSINPENSNFMYFHTQLPGSYKTYGKNADVFWCCTGTGMENHVRYGQSVFFSEDDTIYVCQFFPANVEWEEKGLTLNQQTLFPNEEHSKIVIDNGSANAVIKIRIPSWCKNFSVKVNGSDAGGEVKDGFMCIERNWNQGDEIDIDFPMHLRLEPLADSPRTVAICFGPLVLAGDLGTDGVNDNTINLTDNFYNGYPASLKPTTTVPSLTGNPEELDWIQKDENAFSFTTSATSDATTVTLIPLYKAFKMRFTDYWKIQGELSPEALTYPTPKTGAEPVTELEDGVEYVFQNANKTLACRNFMWNWENLRTQSSGSIDDLKVVAEKTVEGEETYWSFRITSNDYNGRYVGRNNDRNVQVSDKKLWKATYMESDTNEGNGFLLRIKGDTEDDLSAMMMNADGTWVVAWQYANPGTDYTAMTKHWQFFKTADMDPEAMEQYNAANLRLYQHLREALQMYDRGINSVVNAYNAGMEVYTNPNNAVEQINQAIVNLQEAFAAQVSLYEQGVTATYGIINPSFENLSTQNDVPTSGAATRPIPFGWTMTRGEEVIENPTWSWCSINEDGNQYKDGKYIWGIWDGSKWDEIQLAQTLTGLENGKWQLTARLMNNNVVSENYARIFANNSSMLAGNESDYTSLPTGEDCSFSGDWSTNDNDMHQLMTVQTEVTDGTLTLGVRSNAFFKVDDFRLTYLGPTVTTGDVNSDGTINISDVSALISILLGKDNTPPYIYNHDAADINHDNTITISDVSALINILLGR